MNRKFKLDKFVRNNLYQKILLEDIEVMLKEIDNKDELIKYLKKKVCEEFQEILYVYSNKDLCEEIADYLEVIYHLAKFTNINISHINKKTYRKKRRNIVVLHKILS